MAIRGRWAQGIEPRHFRWVLKDQVAVCERPGGYGFEHRKVRRLEEIIWLREQGFNFVVSLIGSKHNLHNYEELGLPYHHVPFAGLSDGPLGLTRVMAAIRDHVRAGHKIVVHREELGETITGMVGAYLLWMGLVPDGPRAIMVTERLFERELTSNGRELVAMLERCDPQQDVPTGAFVNIVDESDDDAGPEEAGGDEGAGSEDADDQEPSDGGESDDPA